MNKHLNHSSVSKMLRYLHCRMERQKDLRCATLLLNMLFKIISEKVAVTKEGRPIPFNQLSINMHDRNFQILASSSDYQKYSFFPHTIKDGDTLPPYQLQ